PVAPPTGPASAARPVASVGRRVASTRRTSAASVTFFAPSSAGGGRPGGGVGGGDGRRLQATIPAGVNDGAKIRLRGAFKDPGGGPAGDVVITVRVQPDPRFERRGGDLVTE